jgi:hypothetical protein
MAWGVFMIEITVQKMHCDVNRVRVCGIDDELKHSKFCTLDLLSGLLV